MVATQKQEGSKDCGLFVIAVATAAAYRENFSRFIDTYIEWLQPVCTS